MELAIGLDEPVLRAAGDPQQPQPVVGLGVETGERGLVFLGQAAGAEGADPGEAIERVEPHEQRLGAAHREAGDGARLASLGGAVGLSTAGMTSEKSASRNRS